MRLRLMIVLPILAFIALLIAFLVIAAVTRGPLRSPVHIPDQHKSHIEQVPFHGSNGAVK